MPQPARKTGPELSPLKRRQILRGARQAFAELGYERTTVDLVAARAGVSKATVYNHFHDKQTLFLAAFSVEADEQREQFRASLGEPAGDVEQALQSMGEKLLAFVVSPATVALYRHTVADADRLPGIGRTLFERGPAVVYDSVAEFLRTWVRRGVLRIDDVRAASIHFVLLCQGDVALKAQLGVERPSKDAIRETVRRGVAVFLRAYGA